LQAHHAGGGAPASDIFATLLRGNFILPCTLCVRANLDREFLSGGYTGFVWGSSIVTFGQCGWPTG